MNEDADQEGMALVPLDEAGTGPPAALLALYDELPGGVVAVVEFERQAIIHDMLEHLRRIRDALAPFGKFKEWCEAAGINYGTVSNRLSRADRKPAVNEPLIGSLPAPVAERAPLSDEDWLRWFGARMRLNSERTGHPLHHKTTSGLVLDYDPTLEAGIRAWQERRTPEAPQRHVQEPIAGYTMDARQEALITQYRERFGDDGIAYFKRQAEEEGEVLREDEESLNIDRALTGFMGWFGHGRYEYALGMLRERRKVAEEHPQFDFRVVWCMWALEHLRVRDLGSLERQMEWDWHWMARVEQLGLTPAVNSPETEADAAIVAALPWEDIVEIWEEPRGEPAPDEGEQLERLTRERDEARAAFEALELERLELEQLIARLHASQGDTPEGEQQDE